jgi:hypothetical protein
VTRVELARRPFLHTWIAEGRSIEAAKLTPRRLHRVVECAIELRTAPEFEHVWRDADGELRSVAPQVADPSAHAPELIGDARFGRRHRSAGWVDGRRGDEYRPIAFPS